MDGFELVRQRARALYIRAAADAEPRGGEVVERLAQDAGYDLVPLEPDDVLLLGGEAVLDRGVAAIFYNGSGDEAYSAALVAHELGHLELHLGTEPSSCSAADIDPGAPEDPVPVAAERVDSYGARERQELQANVFARELLLPGDEARRLFEAGLTASEIANRRGLPLDLVLQQLSHALLVPPSPGVPEEPAVDGLSLDPSQRRAAHHRGSPLLLEAGPGTGKTRTLIARIVHLIESGVDPASILALTFSNKAAGEIADRVAQVRPEAAPRVWTGTFHAFGLELLRQHHQHLDLEAEVTIFDRSDAIDRLEEHLPTLDLVHYQNLYEPALVLKDILAAISRAKDELVDAAGYRALAQAMAETALEDGAPDHIRAAERALEVARVYGVYEEILTTAGAVDFGDLLLRPVRLLEREPLVLAAVRQRFQHVLVDEYQDVNRASARLLSLVAGSGETLWVVGDGRQSIYRFRGASTANMTLFGRDFPGAERLALANNYRSASPVVQTFTAFSRTMTSSHGALELHLEPRTDLEGTGPVLAVAEDSEGEIGAVAVGVEALREEGVPYGDQAVLCRSNARLEAFARGLEARGVPVLHLGSLFEREEVRNLLSLLACLTDRRGDGLLRLLAGRQYAVPLADAKHFLERARKQPGYVVDHLRNDDVTASLSAPARRGLRRLGKDLEGLDRRASPWRLLSQWLFEKRRVTALLDGDGRPAHALKGIAVYQLLAFVRHGTRGAKGWPARRLLDKVRRLVLLAEERDLRQLPPSALHLDAVRLLTLHGSKGLEFGAVHLPGLKVGEIPASYRATRCPPPDGLVTWGEGLETREDPERAAHRAEEECLFFVALSRARHHLRLYRARRAGRSNRRPSDFLNRLGSLPPEVEPPAGPEMPVDIGYVPLSGAPPKAFPAYFLREMERCPRRFFYSFLLRLSPTRKDSAFGRTHRVIHSLLDELREEPAMLANEGEGLRQRLDKLWKESGPTGHGLEPRYRELADGMLEQLITADAERDPKVAPALELGLESGRLELAADLFIEGVRPFLRLFRTGRKGSFKGDGIFHGLLEAAAAQHFGDQAADIEVLHLTDGGRTPVDMSDRKVSNRLKKGERLLGELLAGRFPAHVDAMLCPRCPHFFLCPALPPGELPWPQEPTEDDSESDAKGDDPDA